MTFFSSKHLFLTLAACLGFAAVACGPTGSPGGSAQPPTVTRPSAGVAFSRGDTTSLEGRVGPRTGFVHVALSFRVSGNTANTEGLTQLVFEAQGAAMTEIGEMKISDHTTNIEMVSTFTSGEGGRYNATVNIAVPKSGAVDLDLIVNLPWYQNRGQQIQFKLISATIAPGAPVSGLPLSGSTFIPEIVGPCAAPTIYVPYDCSLSEAVSAARSAVATINLFPGTYAALQIAANQNITLKRASDTTDPVIIDGGTMPAITVGTDAKVVVTAINLRTSQLNLGYTSAALLAQLAESVTISECVIDTPSRGASFNFVRQVVVEKSVIKGVGSASHGVALYNVVDSAVTANQFMNFLTAGVYACGQHQPMLGHPDSNTYDAATTTPTKFDANCSN